MINSSFIYMTRYLSNVEKALLRLMLGFQQHPLAPPITVIFTPPEFFNPSKPFFSNKQKSDSPQETEGRTFC